MESITTFPLPIQYAILKLSDPTLTFEQLAKERGISRQAVEKQCKKAVSYFMNYTGRAPQTITVESKKAHICTECGAFRALVGQLRRQLIINSIKTRVLELFKQKVLKFYPRAKNTTARLPAIEKKFILDALDKFKRSGGLTKEFTLAIQRSPETLARWQAAFDKYGLSGLIDKPARPKHFGNSIPLRIKNLLVALFMQFPNWSPYQYHAHIRHNPASNWYVSLPVITKLKALHRQTTEAEKERIKKRWCFAAGTRAWTVDFTCILQTNTFKLQCLTVSDQTSRFLIHTALYLNTSTDLIINEIEELFIKYGKPDFMKADNGPEFRIEFKDQLQRFAVAVFNSPDYYGQFNGAHERIHRTMKGFIGSFKSHCNLTRLVQALAQFQDEYNYKMKSDYLEGKTPADVFFGGGAVTPKGAEVIIPYEKEGELRMKFTGRDGQPVRMSIPAHNKATTSAALDGVSQTVVSETTPELSVPPPQMSPTHDSKGVS